MSGNSTRALLSVSVAIFAFSMLGSTAKAQFILTNSSTINAGFAGFDGTAATFASSFPNFSSNDGNFKGIFVSSPSNYTGSNGVYAGEGTGAPTAFAVRDSDGPTTDYLQFTVTNNTGAAIPGLAIAYDNEEFQTTDGVINAINLVSDDGSGGAHYDQTNLTGTDTYSVQDDGGFGNGLAAPNVTPGNATYDQSIANGASVIYRFNFTFTGETGPYSGDPAMIGVGAFTLTPESSAPVPEPASISLLGLGALSLLRRRSRR